MADLLGTIINQTERTVITLAQSDEERRAAKREAMKRWRERHGKGGGNQPKKQDDDPWAKIRGKTIGELADQGGRTGKRVRDILGRKEKGGDRTAGDRIDIVAALRGVGRSQTLAQRVKDADSESRFNVSDAVDMVHALRQSGNNALADRIRDNVNDEVKRGVNLLTVEQLLGGKEDDKDPEKPQRSSSRPGKQQPNLEDQAEQVRSYQDADALGAKLKRSGTLYHGQWERDDVKGMSHRYPRWKGPNGMEIWADTTGGHSTYKGTRYRNPSASWQRVKVDLHIPKPDDQVRRPTDPRSYTVSLYDRRSTGEGRDADDRQEKAKEQAIKLMERAFGINPGFFLRGGSSSGNASKAVKAATDQILALAQSDEQRTAQKAAQDVVSLSRELRLGRDWPHCDGCNKPAARKPDGEPVAVRGQYVCTSCQRGQKPDETHNPFA